MGSTNLSFPFLPAHRLHDFDVRIGNTGPEAASLTDIPLCTHHTGTVESGVILNLSCDSGDMMGRYLVVNILGTVETLTMAETKIYGSMFHSTFACIT